jgi:hypothetical protein
VLVADPSVENYWHVVKACKRVASFIWLDVTKKIHQENPPKTTKQKQKQTTWIITSVLVEATSSGSKLSHITMQSLLQCVALALLAGGAAGEGDDDGVLVDTILAHAGGCRNFYHHSWPTYFRRFFADLNQQPDSDAAACPRWSQWSTLVCRVA